MAVHRESYQYNRTIDDIGQVSECGMIKNGQPYRPTGTSNRLTFSILEATINTQYQATKQLKQLFPTGMYILILQIKSLNFYGFGCTWCFGCTVPRFFDTLGRIMTKGSCSSAAIIWLRSISTKMTILLILMVNSNMNMVFQ